MRTTDPLDYELIDAGAGRKIERLGDAVVDRPAPAARNPRVNEAAWESAQARFEEGEGWILRGPLPAPWVVRAHGLRLQLEPTASGQVGWFPEKTVLVDHLTARVAQREAPRVLHLFAYTGAATLALARAGASVTHVDAAPSAVAWARRNAALNEMSAHPIRWIVEDAARWVAREGKRGARYDAVFLDPPSFGRSRGRTWKLERDFGPLLAGCAALLSDQAIFVAVTVHTTGADAPALAAALDRALSSRAGVTESGAIELRTSSGAILPAGVVAQRDFAE